MSTDIQFFDLDSSNGVPDPVAPYSHAVSASGFYFVTGQMPIDPLTDEVVGGGIANQTDQVMTNLKRVIHEIGADFERVVSARAYLTSMEYFDEFNSAYEKWFTGPLPARTCIGVTGLARGADVEIDMVVAK